MINAQLIIIQNVFSSFFKLSSLTGVFDQPSYSVSSSYYCEWSVSIYKAILLISPCSKRTLNNGIWKNSRFICKYDCDETSHVFACSWEENFRTAELIKYSLCLLISVTFERILYRISIWTNRTIFMLKNDGIEVHPITVVFGLSLCIYIFECFIGRLNWVAW